MADSPQASPEPPRICRDFVWGICLMNEQCKYRHELEFESMRAILKFCHDYQNRTGCARPDCTYLHTSREEENLFLTTGQIPRILAERYASMVLPQSMTLPQNSAPEAAPQIYMNDYISQPPPPLPPPSASRPPPPPPPAPLPAPVSVPVPAPVPAPVPTPMNGHMSGKMPTSMFRPMHHPPMSQMPVIIPGPKPVPRPVEQATTSQMPMSMQMSLHMPVPSPMPTILAPPPPPPPPPPPTASTSQTRLTGPIYTVPPPLQPQQPPSMYPVAPPQQPAQSSQQQLPPIFPVVYDPSRPPPPIPSVSQSRKRSAEPEPGTSKVRKTDGCNDSFCESCIQRDIRTELIRQQTEKVQREDEYQRLVLDRKTAELDNGRLLLKSIASPEVFRIVDEYIDPNYAQHTSTSNDLFSSSSSALYNPSHSNLPRHILFQLMEYALSLTNSAVEQEAISRRSNTEAEVLASIFELIRNNGGLPTESRSAIDALNTNGLTRFTNGIDASPPQVAAAAPAARYPVHLLPAVHPKSAPRYPVAPRPYTPAVEPAVAPPAPAPVPAPVHMTYPPAGPPPQNRGFYPPGYPGPSSNVAYTPPAMPQALCVPRASTSAAPPAPPPADNQNPDQTESYAQYMAPMQHQYYPPYQ